MASVTGTFMGVTPPQDHFRRKRVRAIAQGVILLALAVAEAAGQSFFSLRDVHAGLRGTGRTVFSGSRIEEFQVEILGVLENLTPRQSIVLARLSGGPLAETGVLQGMSGSPVYIDGKLLGAIALGFPFAKQPIAGIQPIEQMVGDSSPVLAARSARAPLLSQRIPTPRISSPFGELKEISTPLALSGFSASTIQAFADEFRRLGLEPQQGVGGGSETSQSDSRAMHPGTIQAGSMISVQLLTGDMTISADGTVTYVDGKRVYAFGHRFLDTGSTDLPFARADVVALLPTVNSSYKLSAAREWVGSMTTDRSTAVAGEIGRHSQMIPLHIRVAGADGRPHTYNMNVVNDRLLTSFITQAALFSSIDATERTLGSGTMQLRGRIEFDGIAAPLEIRDIAVSDTSVAQQATADAVATLGFVIGSGFRDLRIKQLEYDLQPIERKRQLRIAQAWASRHDVHPGEAFEITALLEGENGAELTRTANYRVPIGAQPGVLNITVSDANTLNSPDYAGLSATSFRSPELMVSALNRFRSNNAAYARIWRQTPVYALASPSAGADLSDPPPSVALILADPSSSASGGSLVASTRGATLSELRLPVDDYVVIGAKTIQVEIKD